MCELKDLIVRVSFEGSFAGHAWPRLLWALRLGLSLARQQPSGCECDGAPGVSRKSCLL